MHKKMDYFGGASLVLLFSDVDVRPAPKLALVLLFSDVDVSPTPKIGISPTFSGVGVSIAYYT